MSKSRAPVESRWIDTDEGIALSIETDEAGQWIQSVDYEPLDEWQ